MAEQFLGRPDEALRLCDEALRRASQLKNSFDLEQALIMAASVRRMRREPEAARDLAEAARALAEEHGFWVGSGVIAWAKAELGQTEQALVELESRTDSANPFHAEILRPQVYMRVGRIELALEILNQHLAQIERLGAHQNEAEVYLLQGEAILMRDPRATAAAENSFRKAIQIAQGQSAKWWELRATVSLARLLANQGKRDAAHKMLAEIYDWFTEGFDLPDLKEAKALLDELST
jgi:tetratricopeptide (TPR) repeat protein